MAPAYRKKQDYWKLRRIDEWLARIWMTAQYNICEAIRILIGEMARAADVGVRRSSIVSYASRMVELS